jgi:hypothetical protein
MSVIPRQNVVDASAVPDPSDLQTGELAVNAVSGRLFLKTTAGSVIEVGGFDYASPGTEQGAQGYIPGRSGSYVAVGMESYYIVPEKGLRKGSLEVYGDAKDPFGNPLEASVVVCSSDDESSSAYHAVSFTGSVLSAVLYGGDPSATFGSISENSAAIYTDAANGLAIGCRSPGAEDQEDFAAIRIYLQNIPGPIDEYELTTTLSGNVVISEGLPLEQISGGTATAGQVLVWDGDSWSPGSPTADGSVAISGVSSVNGKVGAVSLNALDVGALPSTTFVPTNVGDLNNDQSYATKTYVDTQVATRVSSVSGKVGVVTLTSADVGLEKAIVSDTSASAGSQAVANIVRISSADYASLSPPDSNTLYLITD